ncbi:hypothetical protein D3C81_1897190 [compost metagenome]
MNHSCRCIRSHLLKLSVERFVLNGWLSCVRLTLRFGLSSICRYRIRVVLQLLLNLRFEHRTKRIFVGAIQQFVTPIRNQAPSNRLGMAGW